MVTFQVKQDTMSLNLIFNILHLVKQVPDSSILIEGLGKLHWKDIQIDKWRNWVYTQLQV